MGRAIKKMHIEIQLLSQHLDDFDLVIGMSDKKCSTVGISFVIFAGVGDLKIKELINEKYSYNGKYFKCSFLPIEFDNLLYKVPVV